MGVQGIKRVAVWDVLLLYQRGRDAVEGRLDDEHVAVGWPVMDDGGDASVERGEDRRTREEFAIFLVVADVGAVVAVVFLCPFGMFGVVDGARCDEGLGDIRGDFVEGQDGQGGTDSGQ